MALLLLKNRVSALFLYVQFSRELVQLVTEVRVCSMHFRDPAHKKQLADHHIAENGGNQPTGLDSTEPRSASVKPMKLIPWEDIWTSLQVAKIHGNGDMIDVFYDTLFRESVFDDDGAWSLDQKKRY